MMGFPNPGSFGEPGRALEDFERIAIPTRYTQAGAEAENFNGYFRIKDIYVDPSKSFSES